MVSLEELLAQSDFISLNCTLNPTSYHLIGRRQLRLMKQSAYLINTCRGPVLEEAALIEALQQGWIAGAALDVFEEEPLPAGSPLRSMDNCLLAPHNANSSPVAWRRVHDNTIRNLIEGLDASR
jgi:D-3-phosphoglycerate dehydrogenase